MNGSARAAYLGQMVSTASPARLLVMLYDRLVLDLERAIDAQAAGNHVDASPHLMHAQEIVLELRFSLRTDVWDGGPALADIYAWLHSQLVRANTQRDVAISRDCLSVIRPLGDAWREAALAGVGA